MLTNYNEALSKWLEVIKNFCEKGSGNKKKTISVENMDGEKDCHKEKANNEIIFY